MARPKGSLYPNPQALADVSRRKKYTGHPELGNEVDPDTWLTPRWILTQLGSFDLDPCAAINCPDRIASKWFTKADNGLEQEWAGRVFVNPPFSNTGPWIEKHSGHGNGLLLVPASIESGAWHTWVWPSAKAILFLHGRPRFYNPDGSTTTGRPLRPIALIAWSDLDADVLDRSLLSGVLLKSWKKK